MARARLRREQHAVARARLGAVFAGSSGCNGALQPPSFKIIVLKGSLVDVGGLEPPASSLRTMRSPN
jgi:hypothetical protein